MRTVGRMRPNTIRFVSREFCKITKVLILLRDWKNRHILNEKFPSMALSFMTRLGEKMDFHIITFFPYVELLNP